MRHHWILWSLLALLILIIVGSAVIWFCFPRVVSDIFLGWAEERVEDGETSQAEYWFDTAIWKDPDNEDAIVSYATWLGERKRYTQAESVLNAGMESNPKTVYYITLSSLYVKQDKIDDAVALLDNVENETVKAVLEDLRPTTPTPSMEPGNYNTRLGIYFDTTGTCYIHTDGTTPSVTETSTNSVTLRDEGTYAVSAVAVAENGLVSRMYQGTYILSDLVFDMEFDDPAIEAIVRYALGNTEDTILSTDIRDLTELSCYDADGSMITDTPINSLDDLKYMTGLNTLTLTNISDNVDMTPLASLGQLHTLSLEANNLDSTDMQQIAAIPNLRTLDLEQNQISTLSFLENMTGLETLNLNQNAIVDLTPLSNLTKLKELHLNFNAIEDLTPLASLTSLETLDVGTNRITDMQALSKITALKNLYAEDNLLTDLSSLNALTSLEVLDVSGNTITSLSGISGMTNLVYLDISSNQITDLTGMEGLSRMYTLDISENSISSLVPLSTMTSLKTLYAAHNTLTSVAALSTCSALESVDVEYNVITTLEPLSSCGNLKEVRAYGNTLSTIGLPSSVTVYYE